MEASSGSAGRGRFITIEGPDGGGKTTQAERLRAHLASSGSRVIVTREPGGTTFGERVREMLLARVSDRPGEGAAAPPEPLADALLFNAARHQLVREIIGPALDDGLTVICTRFADSTLAYQGSGAGVPLDRLRRLADIATDGLGPDLTVLLDLPAEVGLARKSGPEETRFEIDFDLGFHRRVRDGFLALAAAEPRRFLVVDATGSIDDVARVIATGVDARLGVAARPGVDEPGTAALRIHR
jgi:dTMP kinase